MAASVSVLPGRADLPAYRIVSSYRRIPGQGMPGPYVGDAIRIESSAAVDTVRNEVNGRVVESMVSRGIRALTGCSTDSDAWARLFTASDVVGIKVNCSGAPDINSNPELVGAIAKGLTTVGVKPENIYIYDRFANQLRLVNFTSYLPAGVKIVAAEDRRGSIEGYDPYTYVEANFFGEEDTRSNLFRPVAETFTKVINVPTMKEHRAAGVTGCLKNIAYGSYSNVARSHERERSNTYSFIGTLAAAEPLRSKTVLNIMDGLRSLWQGGPFLQSPEFLFFPKRIVFGTDPVALDHLLIDMIEQKRKEMGAPSIFDRSPSHLKFQPEVDPQFNSFIREPGHVQYASTLGLGTYEKSRIRERVIAV